MRFYTWRDVARMTLVPWPRRPLPRYVWRNGSYWLVWDSTRVVTTPERV